MTVTSLRAMAVAFLVGVAVATPTTAQEWSPLNRGSDNIEVLGHVPLGPRLSVSDMDLEQEMDRPYAYVGRMQYGPDGPKGPAVESGRSGLAGPVEAPAGD